MKSLPLLLLLWMTTLALSAQIERKPATLRSDTAAAGITEAGTTQNRRGRISDLDLTREQRSKLKELRLANSSAKAAIENNDQLSRADKKKQWRKFQKDQAVKIQAILTPEQWEKFKASRQNNP